MKRRLERENKHLYQHCSRIWEIRNDHMIKEYLVNYFFAGLLSVVIKTAFILCASVLLMPKQWFGIQEVL